MVASAANTLLSKPMFMGEGVATSCAFQAWIEARIAKPKAKVRAHEARLCDLYRSDKAWMRIGSLAAVSRR